MDTTKLDWDLRQIWKHIEELRKKVDSLEADRAMPIPSTRTAPKFWVKWISNNEKSLASPYVWNNAANIACIIPICCFTREMLVALLRAYINSSDFNVEVFLDNYLKSNGGV